MEGCGASSGLPHTRGRQLPLALQQDRTGSHSLAHSPQLHPAALPTLPSPAHTGELVRRISLLGPPWPCYRGGIHRHLLRGSLRKERVCRGGRGCPSPPVLALGHNPPEALS